MTITRIVLTSLLTVVTIASTGCTKSVKRSQVVGTWTLVASSFEPMDTVVANDLFSGWVTFNDDMTYEMDMQEKGGRSPTHRTGTYSLEGASLLTVTGAKVTTSRIMFQGNYLVTVTRQKTNKQDFYIYYLPATEKPKVFEPPAPVPPPTPEPPAAEQPVPPESATEPPAPDLTP